MPDESMPPDDQIQFPLGAAEFAAPDTDATAPVPVPATALIASVSIKRFKKIDNLTFSLGDAPTILVGANNSGKSSVLHAVHFAVSVAQTAKLVGEGVFWASNRFKLSFNPTQLIWSPVADAMSLGVDGFLDETANHQIEITLVDSAAQQVVVTVRRGRNRNIQVVLQGRALGERLQDLERPFSVFTPGLAGIAPEEQFLSPGVVRRSVARGNANLVLRNVLLMLRRDSQKWDLFFRDIQSLFPGIEFNVRFDENSDETIGVFTKFHGGPSLPLDAAGTAVLQATQILGYSALYNPPLVLLDEPDSHLHPNNQRALCRLLTQLSQERQFRLIISTHSRHVLDALRGASRVIWMSQGTLVPEAEASLTARMLDLGALDTVDFFADSQTKCVVITEDSETAALSALLWSCGFVEEDTRIASYGGCTKVEAATVLGQFIEAHATSVDVVVHRDQDYMSSSEISDYESQIHNCDLKAFVTEQNDIEGYFINAQHLAALNSGVTVAQIQTMIDEIVAETRDRSVEAMINDRVERAQRGRASTGVIPNAGQIANQAQADFAGDPGKFRRGKIVLGRLVARVQQMLGANPRIFEPTEYLVCEGLRAIASQIWRPTQEESDI